MTKYALVVGITRHRNFRNLPKAAGDAEALARVLEQYGDFFKVDRLPKRWLGDQKRWEVADDKEVSADDLFNAIKNLLQEAERKEVLIYFAGHGFRVSSRAGKQRGFLAASDSTSDGRNSIALDDDFNTLLEQSNLSSVVVLLDSCYSGSLLEYSLTREVIEPSVSTFNGPRDFYLITACRASEKAREGEKHGIFTEALLDGLSSNNANPKTGRVSVNRLFDFVYQKLQGSGQEPFQLGGGRSLTLVTHQLSDHVEFEFNEHVVPYRGLEPFEKEQADFFFGRKEVIQKIWKILDRDNFVGVIGASGSGKSSVIRAGLIPWLEASGWKALKPIKPGIAPLAKLIVMLEHLFQDNQNQLDEFVYQSQEGLNQISCNLPGSEKFLLVIDQFEELFTQSRTEERDRFIKLITQASEKPYPRIAIVITMRADFLVPCLEYPSLTHLIQNQAIFMPPLLGADLEQAIVEPAKCLGYSFESGLLGEILHDIGRESGSLPLLQFSLLGLWEKRDLYRRLITRKSYHEIGGILGVLNNHAEKIYASMNLLERNWVKKICLILVRANESQKETRQRRAKNRLLEMALDNVEDFQDLDISLQKLVDGRLLVTGEEEGIVWVDLAHETIIQKWSRFSEWCQEELEVRQLINKIESACDEWLLHNKSEEFLMMGGLLSQVKDRWNDLEVYLDKATKDFFEKSTDFIELDFPDGVDPGPFAYAFKKINSEILDVLTIKSIEKKSDGNVLVKITVSPDLEKMKLKKSFWDGYRAEGGLLSGQSNILSLLSGQEDLIRDSDLKALANSSDLSSITVEVKAIEVI